MNQLTIDPDLGSELVCEVGDVLTVTLTGTVTAKTPEGGKTLDVTAIDDYEHAGGAGDTPYGEAPDDAAPALPPPAVPPRRPNDKSAVMIMVKGGKSK